MDKSLLITLNFMYFCLGIVFTISVSAILGKNPVKICVRGALEVRSEKR